MAWSRSGEEKMQEPALFCLQDILRKIEYIFWRSSMDGKSPKLLEPLFFFMVFHVYEGNKCRNATKTAVAMYSVKLCFLHCLKPRIKESWQNQIEKNNNETASRKTKTWRYKLMSLYYPNLVLNYISFLSLRTWLIFWLLKQLE